MPIANLTWNVDSATLDALVAAGFDAWLVQREDAGPAWTELTSAPVRPPLVADVLRYMYTDATAPIGADGQPSNTYQAVPYNTTTAATGTAVTALASRRGYLVPQNVWDEGYAQSVWTPHVVWRAIDRATSLIDSLCSQWFEPRYAQFAFDGTNHDQMWLEVPVCAVHSALQDDVIVDLSDLTIYNRHLTRGQLNPDDRMNPKVTYALDFPAGYRGRRRRLVADAALFGGGRINVVLKGIYGFTELVAGDFAAETVTGNQIPISYGGTPTEITRAALLLTLNFMKPADEQQEAALEGRLTEIRTRDQVLRFADPTGADSSYGLTGNLEVDNILMRYAGPLRIGAVGL